MRRGGYSSRSGADIQARRVAYLEEAAKRISQMEKKNVVAQPPTFEFVLELPHNNDDNNNVGLLEKISQYDVVMRTQVPRPEKMVVMTQEQVKSYRESPEFISSTKHELLLKPVLPMVVHYPPLMLYLMGPHAQYTSFFRAAFDLRMWSVAIEKTAIKLPNVSKEYAEHHLKLKQKRHELLNERMGQALDKMEHDEQVLGNAPPSPEQFVELCELYAYDWMDLQIAYIDAMIVQPFRNESNVVVPPLVALLTPRKMARGSLLHHVDPANREMIIRDAEQFFRDQVDFCKRMMDDDDFPEDLTFAEKYRTELQEEQGISKIWQGYIGQKALWSYYKWLQWKKHF